MQGTYRVLTGPTAAGKTAWLLARAGRRPVRVISADSRQVYRGMDIGTGRPSASELVLAPHYGIDLLDPGEPYSAHDFLVMAASALSELGSEQFSGEVWVCGGTGLYIRALAQELKLGPPPRPMLRAAIWELISERGPATVSAELGLAESEQSNPVRVLRRAEAAAEQDGERVYGYAGLSAVDLAVDTAAQARSDATATGVLDSWRCEAIHVLDPGPELSRRIRTRVSSMFQYGLVDEVRRLRNAGYGRADVVSGGIGYAEAGAVLDSQMTLEAAIERTVVRTRQYAKRQRTYFRGQRWISGADPMPEFEP